MLNGVPFTVDPNTKLGHGSEGMVVESPHDPRSCIKLFHEPDPAEAAARQIAAYRSRKVQAICAAGLRLPEQFVLPQQPVYDVRNGRLVIGYQMRRVPAGNEKRM